MRLNIISSTMGLAGVLNRSVRRRTRSVILIGMTIILELSIIMHTTSGTHSMAD